MIGRLLHTHKRIIRDRHRFYSQDLINNIFRHPYTKVAFLARDLGVSRATATRYLYALAKDGIKDRDGRQKHIDYSGRYLQTSRTGMCQRQSASHADFSCRMNYWRVRRE